MGKAGLTIGSINGIDVNKNVRCQFCGSDMRQGSCHLGSGTNSISYWCDGCGALASFFHNSDKPIKSIETKFIYED